MAAKPIDEIGFVKSFFTSGDFAFIMGKKQLF
jgi:hypothetical protein